MYKVQEKPDASVKVGPEETEHAPLVTLKDEYGGVFHIILDDHCYLLIGDIGQGRNSLYPVYHWFSEAAKALADYLAAKSKTKDHQPAQQLPTLADYLAARTQYQVPDGRSQRASTGEVMEMEVVGTGNGGHLFRGAVSYVPVEPGTVRIASGVQQVVDDCNGNLRGHGTGNINYETGKFTVTFGAPTECKIEALYEHPDGARHVGECKPEGQYSPNGDSNVAPAPSKNTPTDSIRFETLGIMGPQGVSFFGVDEIYRAVEFYRDLKRLLREKTYLVDDLKRD